MDFLEKLNFLMERYNLNKRTLSQKSNIPYTTINNWYKRGYENLTIPTMRKLSSYFNTTLDFWFLDDVTDPNYGKSSGFKVDYKEMEHVKQYRNLDKQGKLHVDTVLGWETERIKELSRQQKQDVKTQKETPPFRIIQYYQRLASAGKGEYLFDDIPADTIKVKDTPVSRKADFVIGVNGNSMEPDYHDGEKVFVEKTSDLETGEVGIFVRGEECFIKELGKNGLISRNEEYPLITPSEDIKVVGKVTGKVQELL